MRLAFSIAMNASPIGWLRPSSPSWKSSSGRRWRPDLDFQLGELGLSQQFGDAFIAIEKASLIDQRGHLFPGGERPPPIKGHIADDGQVNTEGNLRMVREQLHGMQRPGTRNHQGRRTDHACRE